MPESEQVGCDDSMQRRYPSATAAQDGVMELSAAQLIEQSAVIGQPVCAILLQMAEQEAETSAAEQLSPHVANGPASPSWLLRAAPPHPTADQSVTNIAPQRIPKVLMGALTTWMIVRSSEGVKGLPAA
ncbi:MAG: hypothetical protein ACLP1X_02205, partial [Polyangiaceae bacterium]